MKHVLWTVVGVVVLLLVVIAVVMYSGRFNVAAAGTSGGMLDWVLSTTMDNSVHAQASGITAPPLQDSSLVEIGFNHYRGMCVMCHGSPSRQPSAVGVGLNPSAPELSEASQDWTPAELFWIIKNGVRMTGMPSFGATHTDRELWAVVAFLQKLQKMTPAEYKAFDSSRVTTREQNAGEHHHEEEHR